jgi:ribose transport system permease protein
MSDTAAPRLDGIAPPRKRYLFREAGIVGVLALMMVVLAVLTRSDDGSTFLAPGNLVDVALAFSFVAIMAVGEMLVIISGGIDLSVGSNLAVSGIVTAMLLKSGQAIVVACFAGLAIGAAFGVVNALLIIRANLPPFIATLGTMSIGRGLAYALCHGWPISGLPESFNRQAGGQLIPHIPTPVLVMVLVVLGGSYLLNLTRWGRYFYAVGGNEEAARFAGVQIGAAKLWVYALCGLCCGAASILMTAWLGVAQSTAGQGYELDVIAAAVIGGASLSGGYGTALGALLGASIMGVLRNGLVLLNVPDYYQMVAIGLVILIAVMLDTSRKD